MKIDKVSKNLNPLDFWGCLGWREIAEGMEWTDCYDDNCLYFLITKDFETPVIALFTLDYGGAFTVWYHSSITRKYYYIDCGDIQYVAEMPCTTEVIESIEAICDKVESEVIKWTPQGNETDLGNQ